MSTSQTQCRVGSGKQDRSPLVGLRVPVVGLTIRREHHARKSQIWTSLDEDGGE